MSAEIELPEMHQGELRPEELDDLLRDVELATELLGVTVKGAPRERTGDVAVPLAEARERLLRGEVRGIQLRYRYQGSQWWDTVLRAPSGFRLVRIRHDFGPPGSD